MLFGKSVVRDKFPGKTGVSLYMSRMASLVGAWASFRRLAIGCCVMWAALPS